MHRTTPLGQAGRAGPCGDVGIDQRRIRPRNPDRVAPGPKAQATRGWGGCTAGQLQEGATAHGVPALQSHVPRPRSPSFAWRVALWAGAALRPLVKTPSRPTAARRFALPATARKPRSPFAASRGPVFQTATAARVARIRCGFATVLPPLLWAAAAGSPWLAPAGFPSGVRTSARWSPVPSGPRRRRAGSWHLWTALPGSLPSSTHATLPPQRGIR